MLIPKRYKTFIYSVEIKEHENTYKLEFILKTGQGGTTDDVATNNAVNASGNSTQNISGSLRADKFLEFLTPQIKWNITRESVLDKNFRELV